jgi:hypothetical protein
MKLHFDTLGLLCLLCASVVNCSALDREAFSFTNYDLNVRLEPEQHRIGVRGKVTLRNDSSTPQATAVLQISSSLDWRSITLGGKPVQFMRQPYTSDIDHTGALSEAVVTLPQPIAPHATVDLDIAYEGVILSDTTRLTRIGTPEDIARSNDWDQIDQKFTAVRGIGYVAWYPIASESANLSEPESLPEILKRWNDRSVDTRMSVSFQSSQELTLVCSGDATSTQSSKSTSSVFTFHDLNTFVPTFAMADYQNAELDTRSSIAHLPGEQAIAEEYAATLSKLDTALLGQNSKRLQIVELPDRDAASFVTDGILLMPLKSVVTPQDRLTLVYALARQQNRSPRLWITEGLAHYAQVLDLERQQGREVALNYLVAHLPLLAQSEQVDPLPKSRQAQESQRSLINMSDDVSMQAKAMWVWWMLREMIGGKDPAAALQRILRQYDAAEDRDPAYLEHLIETASHRDLKWFFDDWVYNERGLPNFKVDSVYSSKTSQAGFLVTITVENDGAAGAEVPLIVKFAGGELRQPLEVHANSKAVIRVETSAAPEEVVVNDGSVPENDMKNNQFKVRLEQK